LQPIRTPAEITAHIKIFPTRQPYLYQKLSKKATQLRLLGMSYQQIAKSLNIIGHGLVKLPDALSKKYPNASKEWGWHWVFPAKDHYIDNFLTLFVMSFFIFS